jgi:UPF0755 protein
MRGRLVLAAAVACALAVGCAATAGAAVTPSAVLRISFPEGFSVRQMVDRVAQVRLIAIRKRHVKPVLTAAAYRKAAAHAAPPAAFAAADRRHSIEGFLFPSLYDFGPSTTAPQLISLQLQAFEREWQTVDLRAAQARRLSAYDVLIVASMVEREAAVASERPLVAAVIYNRLATGMPLGIDATIRYGLGIPGTQSLTRAELASPSPYNTRLHKGLPPTPIGNPGLASIRAAAHPAEADYLYYLRRPHSTRHYFTADYADFCAKSHAWGYGGC